MTIKFRSFLSTMFILFVLTSFIPLNRTNPDSHFDTDLPDSVKSILKVSCYDCHSNETKWPFYSYISPISFLVTHHVSEGREHLNFSLWGIYNRSSKQKKAGEILEVLDEGEMPLKSYLIIHRNAKLKDSDKQLIYNYFKTFAHQKEQTQNSDNE